MKFFAYKNGEEIDSCTAKGYLEARKKIEKKGFSDFKVFREDDTKPVKKKKSKSKVKKSKATKKKSKSKTIKE